MPKQRMSTDVMEYMVWVAEIAAAEFFGGDKTAAYTAMKNCGLWDIYADHYDTTHALGREYLLDEIKAYFETHEVKI